MAYDPYAKIPKDLRPTPADELAIPHLASNIKEAARLRHDFHTALHIADTFTRIGQAFLPAILQKDERPAERHLNKEPPPPWESAFAQSFRPDAKTAAGIAAEHQRLSFAAKTMVAGVKGNAKLAVLLKNNIDKLIPPIGYSAAGGALRRLRTGDAGILKAFHPLGVGDIANIINLILLVQQGGSYYW